MQTRKTIFAIDSHTMGEPLRLIVGGFPNLPGKTVEEKRAYFIQHYDHLRCAVMQEPRGHRDMFGALLVQPTLPEADLGVFFMHGSGYHNMCGHGTIATATIAVENGLVPVTEPETVIRLETPAGLVTARVAVEEGRAQSVSFRNVPAFVYRQDASVEVPGWGQLTVDIAFGGNFFVLVDGAQLGIPIGPENAAKLTEAGMAILDAVNRQIPVEHPELPYIRGAAACEIYGLAQSPEADLRNVAVFDGQIDRSPCGTGTSAKVALLCARQELALNQDFVYESIIGTRFTARAVEKTRVGDFEAVIPQITGSAYITGFSQLLIDERDPVKYGFVLS